MIWHEMTFPHFICTGTLRQVGCVCMIMVIHHSLRMCSELENGTTSKIETHGCIM